MMAKMVLPMTGRRAVCLERLHAVFSGRIAGRLWLCALWYTPLSAGAAAGMPAYFHAGWLPLLGVPAAACKPRAFDPAVHPLWAGCCAALASSVGIPVLHACPPRRRCCNTGLAVSQNQSENPYFLYAASNLGSFGGLLAYPLLMEPSLTLNANRRAMHLLPDFLAVIGLVCDPVISDCARSCKGHDAARIAQPQEPVPRHVPKPACWKWLALSFVSSSLLYGVTSYIVNDIASDAALLGDPAGALSA